MRKFKKIIFIWIIYVAVLTFPFVVSAKAFVAHLYYDSAIGELKFDSKKESPVTIDSKQTPSQLDFLEKSTSPKGEYWIVLYDVNGKEIGKQGFNAKKGSFEVVIPFFPFSSKISVYTKNLQEEIFSADVTRFSSCNDNGICEIEKGESLKDCMVDCGKSDVDYSPETLEQLKEKEGVIKDPETGEIIINDPEALITKKITNSQQAETLDANDQKNAINKESSSQKNILFTVLLVIFLFVVIGMMIYTIRKVLFKK